ncbi:MAG: methyltransferase domain-containing protein [Ferruginibacter sp.]
MGNHKLDQDFWNQRYINRDTGWDIGDVSLPLKEYFEQLANKDISVLLPGCGNAHEAAWLLQNGFTDITLVDISPQLVQNLSESLAAYNGKQVQIICADFFEITGAYDLIIEQTFFCALNPSLRQKYADKMYSLLKAGGKLAGVFFNRDFEGGPPFGGSKEEYEEIFSKKFDIQTMQPCYNSISARAGTELFVIMSKK